MELKSTNMQIVVPAGYGGSKLSFQLNPYLQGANSKVHGVVLWLVDEVAVSPITNGTPLITFDQSRYVTLTLNTFDIRNPGNVGGKGNWIDDLPIIFLHSNFLAGGGNSSARFGSFSLDGQSVDWTKSYVTLNPGATWDVDRAIVFGVFYK